MVFKGGGVVKSITADFSQIKMFFMIQYICTSEGKEAFNVNGKSLGIQPKRAICYSTAIGRKRLYRSGFDKPDHGLKILTFTTKAAAQGCCDGTNEKLNDDFVVEERQKS